MTGAGAAFPDLAPAIAALAPALRGRLTGNAPLAPYTWFRVGGPAQALFQPADEADLAELLARLPAEIPVTTIGLGSNLIVRDGGIAGVVIRLGGRAFGAIEAGPGHRILAGAAAPDIRIAAAAAEAGIAGLEFYRGIPGSLGGALRMNAGAHGGDTAAVLVEARGVDRAGAVRALDAAAMGFAYRHTSAPADVIFTRAILQGRPGDPAAIGAEMARVTAAREAAQPIREKTGGSTFKNPPGERAWVLIDRAGCRGLTLGDAAVSTLHCNFLINRGAATAAEIEALGEEVRRRVRETSGVELEWEIRRVGEAGQGRGLHPASGDSP
ncbi:MAG: UDP-N-acetylmuramate dehydrogenase [Roseiarcus sp.]